MKINHQKAKERLTMIFITLFVYIIIVDPIIKWFTLEDNHPLSAWYFVILFPLLTFMFYGFIFLVFYSIIWIFMWVLGVEEDKK